jgi:hypothetical protein
MLHAGGELLGHVGRLHRHRLVVIRMNDEQRLHRRTHVVDRRRVTARFLDTRHGLA